MRKTLTHMGHSQVVSYKISNGVLKFYCAGATDSRSCWILRIVILTSCYRMGVSWGNTRILDPN
jgi:hypothetical protein